MGIGKEGVRILLVLVMDFFVPITRSAPFLFPVTRIVIVLANFRRLRMYQRALSHVNKSSILLL